MLPSKLSQKMFCAIAAAAFAAGGVAACGKDESKGASTPENGNDHAVSSSTAATGSSAEGGATVTYEVTSSVDKPFKVSYIAKTSVDGAADLMKTLATDTATSTWQKEVTLSKGTDYAFVIVTLDPTNFDSTAKFSCKITSDWKTVDEKKDQSGVAGCAGLKLQDQVKKAGS